MKKRFSTKIFILICATLVLAAAYGGYRYASTYTWIDRVRHRRDAARLDLTSGPLESIRGIGRLYDPDFLDLRNTGLTREQYRQIRAWHPDCEIWWSVPFQGGFVDSRVQVLSLDALGEADVDVLASLPCLTAVDASRCQDYAALEVLQRRCPTLEVRYDIELAGKGYAPESRTLTLENANGEELLERLKFLPELEHLTLTGTLPPPDQLAALREAHPGVALHWTYTALGVSLSEDTTELHISGVPLNSTDALEEMLAYGPSIRKLEVLDSGLDSASLLRLQQRHPEVRILWNMEVGGQQISTDITELDISGTPISDPAQVEALLSYLPDVKKLILCDCGLSSAVLDALNRKYPDVELVWNISIGNKAKLRTDATYFMPHKLNITVKSEDLRELRYCTDMVCIDVGHMPITDCDFVACMPHLKYLIIADTKVASLEPLRGLEELIYLEAFMTDVTDYTPLLSCPALEDLNLCFTHGDWETLAQMPQLKRLWWGPLWKISLNTDMVQTLRERLPDTQIEFPSESTGSRWRKHQNYRDMRDALEMCYLD